MGEDAAEVDQKDDSENTNNNADNEPGNESTSKKRRTAKHRVAPKPPTCGLLIVLYGERGKTPALSLKSSAPSGSSSFQPGCADDFKVIILEYFSRKTQRNSLAGHILGKITLKTQTAH